MDNSTFLNVELKTDFNWIINLLIKSGISCNQSNLLDLSCGDGSRIISLSHYFDNCYGLDTDIKNLKIIRNKIKLLKFEQEWIGLYKLRLYKTDFSKIPIKKLDVILLFDYLNTVEDIELSLKNISLHLKPGGIIFIAEPYKKEMLPIEILDNKDLLKEKVKNLKITRKNLREFLKTTDMEILVQEKNYNNFLVLLKVL